MVEAKIGPKKSSILAKLEQQAERLGWVRFVLPSSSAQGDNEHFLMNLQVWGKRLQLFFAYFHQFPCATERWSSAQLWRALKAEPLWFQVALGVTYKHTQKQP